MARLRLVVVALAACRAEAAPTSGVHVPASWQALPELASDVTAAVKPEAVEAWGDPAMGCYATWFALHGAGGAPDPDRLLAELAKDAAGIAVTDIVKPEGAGKLSVTFERAPYKGRLRATLATDGGVAALACFWNAREPIACEQACTGVLGSLR